MQTENDWSTVHGDDKDQDEEEGKKVDPVKRLWCNNSASNPTFAES